MDTQEGHARGMHSAGMTHPQRTRSSGATSDRDGTEARLPLSGRKAKYTGQPPLRDIPSGCCFFTGPWALCRPLRLVLLLHSRSPVVGVPELCGKCRSCVSGAEY